MKGEFSANNWQMVNQRQSELCWQKRVSTKYANLANDSLDHSRRIQMNSTSPSDEICPKAPCKIVSMYHAESRMPIPACYFTFFCCRVTKIFWNVNERSGVRMRPPQGRWTKPETNSYDVKGVRHQKGKFPANDSQMVNQRQSWLPGHSSSQLELKPHSDTVTFSVIFLM